MMHARYITSLVFGLMMVQFTTAQNIDSNKVHVKKNWYETFSIRGYAQVRYNGLFQTNPDLKNEQGDRSWGGNNGFFIRRLRLVFSGQLNKHVTFYIQPDFASSASSTSLHFGQIRDAYFDIGIDAKNEFRFRVGQSKVPYGFENMQSSQNRLPLDRNDALNSAVANERDLGVFFYWASAEKRKLFQSLVNDGLKGSGDYGIIGIGAYNGQTANKPELNNQQHIVARVCYPFQLKSQIVEFGLQAYTGNVVIASDQISVGTKINANKSYLDQRVAASFIIYPKPFGLQAEYNIGKGPEFNIKTDSIELRKLYGGYVMASYKANFANQVFIPFTRLHTYNGGKKHELDARSYVVNELEVGVEWQANKNFELVAMYTVSKRRFEDFKNQANLQTGSLLRLQAQVNF